jgi:hypothetical protein
VQIRRARASTRQPARPQGAAVMVRDMGASIREADAYLAALAEAGAG